MMLDFENLVSFLPLAFIGCAALASTRALIFVENEPLRILAKTWWIMFMVEIVGHYTRGESSNYWLYNVFHFVYYPLLASIYGHILKSEKIRHAISVFYVAFIMFALCNSVFIQGIRPLQTLTLVFGGCFISLLGVLYFWQLFISDDNDSITRDPFFWLSFGLVLYFGGTVPFLGMFNYLHKNFPDFTAFYFTYISNAFSIILNIIIIISFLCRISYPRLS
jgi:hypothetical protein